MLGRLIKTARPTNGTNGANGTMGTNGTNGTNGNGHDGANGHSAPVPHSSIELAADSVSNFTAADELYMGALTLSMPDHDTLVEQWKSFKNGKVVPEHSHDFELRRKK